MKVATVTFGTDVRILPEGKREASFVVPTDDSDDDDDDDDYSHRIRLKLDIHFEGLTPLRAFKDANDHLIDVVAVTGLGGHAYGSFKERGGDHMWLRDALPQDLDNAQIYLYGYDSRLPNSQSFQGIVALATTLRQRLQRLRSTEQKGRPVPRPLVFIAHSLGGILVKEAIVQMQDDSHDQRMLKTVFGALFFGVPNHGMDITSLRTMVRGQPNEHLVTQLGPDSDILDRLATDFERVFNFSDSRIACFCETALSPTAVEDPKTGVWELNGPAIKLVGSFSAKSGRLRDRESHQLNPINRNHSDLVKFPLYDDVYETVRATLRNFASNAPSVIYPRFTPHPSLKLHKAAESGDVVRVNLLLSCGADADEANSDSMTPMHIAAQHGHVDIIRILIKKGAKMSQAAGQHCRTPLHCAVLEGHIEAVRVLVQSGTDIDARARYGDTALHSAAALGHAEIVRVLIQCGARVNATSRNGCDMPLHFALEAEILQRCPGGKNEALDALVALGANINARLDSGQLTPLHYAVRAGNTRVSRMFLDAGADVDAVEEAGSTSPLHESVRKGNAELLCLLLEKGASINARDREGRTPLFIAAARGELTVIPELLRYDPEFDVRDYEHKLTALEIARQNEHWKTVGLLESQMSVPLSLKEEPNSVYGREPNSAYDLSSAFSTSDGNLAFYPEKAEESNWL
ncbi:MAG: hypothetical protein M1822_006698 [Bathelium mastoideum]|nr:MAG: hypothetical protein M1822_006698 [Bathelium mastoideum]